MHTHLKIKYIYQDKLQNLFGFSPNRYYNSLNLLHDFLDKIVFRAVNKLNGRTHIIDCGVCTHYAKLLKWKNGLECIFDLTSLNSPSGILPPLKFSAG